VRPPRAATIAHAAANERRRNHNVPRRRLMVDRTVSSSRIHCAAPSRIAPHGGRASSIRCKRRAAAETPPRSIWWCCARACRRACGVAASRRGVLESRRD
jgi:hypothetical protein